MNTSAQYRNFVQGNYNPSYFNPNTEKYKNLLADTITDLELTESDVLADEEVAEYLNKFWLAYDVDKARNEAGTSVSTPPTKTRSTKPKAERKPKVKAAPKPKAEPKTKTAAKAKAAKPKAAPKPKAAAKPKAKKMAPAASAMTQRKMEKLKKEVEQKAGTITNLKKLLSEEKQRLAVAKKLIDQEESKVRRISAIADPSLPTTTGKPRKNPPKAKATKKADQVRRVAERKGVRKSSLLSKRRTKKK